MSTLPDLGAIFDEHVASEFVAKDVDATMRTMTAEPYVWHVPALTGAAGAEAVRLFLHPISRTVSPERVIDESSSGSRTTATYRGCSRGSHPRAAACASRWSWATQEGVLSTTIPVSRTPVLTG